MIKKHTFTLLFQWVILFALLFLFYNCGSCGKEESDGDNGAGNGTTETQYDTSIITGKIDSSEIEKAVSLIPDPTPMPETAVFAISLDQLISRSDVLDENGEFSLEVPVDKPFFIIVAGVDSSESFKKSESEDEITPLGVVKFEKSEGWDSTLEIKEKDKEEDAGDITFDKTSLFFKAGESSIELDEEETVDSSILIDESQNNNNLTLIPGVETTLTLSVDGLDGEITYSSDFLPSFCALSLDKITCTADSDSNGVNTFIIYAENEDKEFIKIDVTLFVKKGAEIYSLGSDIPSDIEAVSINNEIYISIGKNNNKERRLVKFVDGEAEILGQTLGGEESSKSMFIGNYLVILYQQNGADDLLCDTVDILTGTKVKSGESILEDFENTGDFLLIQGSSGINYFILVYNKGNAFFAAKFQVGTKATNYEITTLSNVMITSYGDTLGALLSSSCNFSPESGGDICNVIFGDQGRIDSIEFSFNQDGSIIDYSDIIPIYSDLTLHYATTSTFLDMSTFQTLFFSLSQNDLKFYYHTVVNQIPQGEVPANIFNDTGSLPITYLASRMGISSGSQTLNIFNYSLSIDMDANFYSNVKYANVDPDDYELLYSSTLASSTFKPPSSDPPPFEESESFRLLAYVILGEDKSDFMLFYPDYNEEEGEFVIKAIW